MATLAPQSPVDVCNIAADKLGVAPIKSIDPPVTHTEQVFARHYDESRRNIIRGSNLNFSKARATIARTGTPEFDYSDQYDMPPDFLRLLTINEYNLTTGADTLTYWYNNFDFAGNSLLINANGALSLEIRYTKDEIDVTKWDAGMARIVALDLAIETCIALVNDKQLLGLLTSLYTKAIGDSLATGGQENRPRRIQRSRALEARLGVNTSMGTLGNTYIDFGG